MTVRQTRGMAFIAAFSSAATLALAVPPTVWDIRLSLPQQTYVEREPVLVRIEYQNVSEDRQRLYPRKPQSVEVSLDGGPAKLYYYFETLAEQVEDRGILPAITEPGGKHLQEYWLVLGKSNLREDWEFIFGKAGHYVVTFPDYGGKSVDLNVGTASKTIDKSGSELFSVAAAAVFLGDEERPDRNEGITGLQAICSRHDSSKFAPYAALALADLAWKQQGRAAFDMQAINRYVDLVIEKHPSHHLYDKAMYLRARGLNATGKRDQIQKCVDALRKRGPDSKYINSIETQFGVESGAR